MHTNPQSATSGLHDLLVHDHERLDKLFDDLLAAFRADARPEAGRLWAQFDKGLVRHLDVEEKSIFPAFAAIDPVEVAQLLDEHRRIRSSLMELGIGVDLHLTRADAVTEFIELLRAHARREDALVYRWAEANLGGESRTLVEDRLDRR